MDVAKRIAQWREQSPEQWLKAANRFLPAVVTTALVLAIAYQLAGMTWRLLPAGGTGAPSPSAAAAPSRPAGSPAGALDFTGLRNAHLFGEAPAGDVPVEPTVADAPDTALGLNLTGILFRGEGDSGLAIIASGRSQEKTYHVGQAIEGGSGARLHSVHGDRVLLNRAGRLETLRLPKELSGAAAPPRALPAPARSDDDAGSLRQVISENASRLTDVLRVTPHTEGGQVIGFRLNPGRDREAFTALGLQPGDVVTDINGTTLDDPSRGLQVFEALGEATMANVTVLRDGTPQVLVIDTSQLQSLKENRQ